MMAAELLPTLVATLAVALAWSLGWRSERRDGLASLRREYEELRRAHSELALHVAGEHVANRADHRRIRLMLDALVEPECDGKGAAIDSAIAAAIGELDVERGKVVFTPGGPFVAGEPERN